MNEIKFWFEKQCCRFLKNWFYFQLFLYVKACDLNISISSQIEKKKQSLQFYQTFTSGIPIGRLKCFNLNYIGKKKLHKEFKEI